MSIHLIRDVVESEDQRILDLKAASKAVLMVLAYHTRDELGYCWPSMTTLVRETGVPERSLHKALGELVKRKLIEIEPGNGRGNTNLYTLHVPQAPDTPRHGRGFERETPHTRRGFNGHKQSRSKNPAGIVLNPAELERNPADFDGNPAPGAPRTVIEPLVEPKENLSARPAIEKREPKPCKQSGCNSIVLPPHDYCGDHRKRPLSAWGNNGRAR